MKGGGEGRGGEGGGGGGRGKETIHSLRVTSNWYFKCIHKLYILIAKIQIKLRLQRMITHVGIPVLEFLSNNWKNNF